MAFSNWLLSRGIGVPRLLTPGSLSWWTCFCVTWLACTTTATLSVVQCDRKLCKVRDNWFPESLLELFQFWVAKLEFWGRPLIIWGYVVQNRDCISVNWYIGYFSNIGYRYRLTFNQYKYRKNRKWIYFFPAGLPFEHFFSLGRAPEIFFQFPPAPPREH